MNIRSTVLLAMSLSLFGCALAGPRIETNPEKWLGYEIHYAGRVVSLKVPPNHVFEDMKPFVLHIPYSSSEPITQIFSAQYDYGWWRWAKISQFEVTYTFVKLETPLPSDASVASIGKAISDVYERELGRPPAEVLVTERATDNMDASWIHKFDPDDPYTEYYAKLCSPDLVLKVTVHYFKKDKVKDADWLKKRQALFHKMVAQV